MRGAAVRAAPFSADGLAHRLGAFMDAPYPPAGFLVAWSGGADSTALLVALTELRDRLLLRALPPVRALHIDHGLQPASRAWATHCRREARRLGVALLVRRVDVARAAGESPEAAARRARYAAFAAALRPGEHLLLAQHAQDQLETLLLQLLRGAGPAGLAAMPVQRPFARGVLLRPLLDTDPEALRVYLRARGTGWIEDPSNGDIAFDRNYLRAEVLPRLRSRWPAMLRTSARGLRHLAAASREAERRDRQALERVADGDGIALPLLRRLARERWPGVLRAWIVAAGHPVPDEARLGQLARLVELRDDAQGCVSWAGCEARCHQGRLLLRAADVNAPQPEVRWRWRRTPAVPFAGGELRLRVDVRGDVDLDALPALLLLRGRPVGRAVGAGGGTVDVKSLLRESGTPAWQRAGLPFAHGPRGLLAIADLWLDAGVRASAVTRRRGRFIWQPK
jgi:tRNA(Ile)-lysidine synthase